MRTSIFALLPLLALAAGAAQTAPQQRTAPPYKIVDRGEHYRVWATTSLYTNGVGRVFTQTNSYTELATGMHHKVGSNWVESADDITITADGAAATNAGHRVHFSGDANATNALRLTMPDGRTLSSHVVGLSYLDTATGSNVLASELRSSIGQVFPSGRVLYTNALIGDFDSDILYKFSKAGLEQNIIIRTRPATSLAEYGLNPATTLLQVWTEFVASPNPTVRNLTGRSRSPADVELDFGPMKIGSGTAFTIGDSATNKRPVRVTKEWVHLQNRTFLVEQVPISSVAPQLQALPQSSSAGSGTPGHARLNRAASGRFVPPILQAKAAPRPIQLAKLRTDTEPGFLIDYSILSSQTNMTLQADTTYFVSNAVYLSGTTVIEGGVVVKFQGTTDGSDYLAGPSLYPSSSVGIFLSGSVVCKTAPYRPAVFTAKDDNSVGSVISGSTGDPNSLFYGVGLGLPDNGGTLTVKNLRFSYLECGIIFNSYEAGSLSLWDVQAVSCLDFLSTASGGAVSLNNCLFHNVRWGLSCADSTFTADHITVHNGIRFGAPSDGGGSSLSVSNSLIVGASPADYNLAYTQDVASVVLTNDAGVFQTVGAASDYLADNSPYRGAGTININPDLLAELRQKTTYPPNILYTPGVYVSNSISLSPVVPRDNRSSAVDLGYHYDPIDWAISYLSVTNATITINPGTVITPFASIGDSGFSYPGGIAISMGAQLSAEGTPASPVRFVENSTVQEHSTTNWTSKPYAFILPSVLGGTPASIINCRFVDFSSLAQDCKHFSYGYGYALPVNARDCQFHGGIINLAYHPINLTNCLLERVACYLYWDDDSLFSMRNNFFLGGDFELSPGATNAVVKDNLFDHTTIAADFTGCGYDVGNNAYVTNCDRVLPVYTNDIVLASSLAFQTGPLGKYYQPTNSPLIDAGSTTADTVGLYHYTVTTNLVSGAELKEGMSQVDIGIHYVAVDANGNFIDTDGDGVPDFVEDAKGSGGPPPPARPIGKAQPISASRS